MATPTQPLDPTVVEFEQKVRAGLIGTLLVAFVIIIGLWTFKPPQLPGDMAGTIIGGFVGWIGGLLTTWKNS